MPYSQEIRETVLRKVLPPSNRTISEVSKEMGISHWTIYRWLKDVGGDRVTRSPGGPRSRKLREKWQLLLEWTTVDEERRGLWLREKGLHSEHLLTWGQEFRDNVVDKQENLKAENRRLKKEKKALEKELTRKEKALAELAALLALKKKAQEIWGDREDD